jgi:hypothetical protein
VRLKISPGVDGGLSGGSSVRRPRSEDPHRRQWKLFSLLEQVLCLGKAIINIIVKVKLIVDIIVTVKLNFGRKKNIMNIIVTVQLNLGRNKDIINIIVTVQLNYAWNKDIINIIFYIPTKRWLEHEYHKYY